MPCVAVRSSDARVALIGYGLAGGALHAPLIAAVPGLELAAVVTRDEERRASVRAAHPGAELLASADEVWGRGYDLAVVAAPNRAHVPLARAAIAAGLPVVVDKPLAPDARSARELVGEARERGVMLTVFQNRRWDGDFLTARRLIESGELGRVLRFESRFERWRPKVKEGWRELPGADEAGGVLFDLGSHLVDQALQLFGPVRELHAEVDVRRPGARVDDDSFLALEHESGVRSHLWMSAVAADLGPRLRVLGDRASYVKHGLDVQEAALRAGGDPSAPGWGDEPEAGWGRVGAGEEFRPVRTEPGAYARFYEGVARALAEGGPPPVDPADAVAVLELLGAARLRLRG
ncbi:MAG: scyllo-inositol 2-dehydrogenase [Thermoleophilaceae bacterium]|jgi:predicted dehydrogenase|nr:scyllo-inositol 2-dehydrogenase [Thermoleophilaceae bacterium]